jgi:hypothetical protein
MCDRTHECAKPSYPQKYKPPPLLPDGCLPTAVFMICMVLMGPVLLHYLFVLGGLIERWWAFWGFKW